MGAWDQITFVRCGDGDAVEQALVRTLERFGMRRVPPTQRPRDEWAPLQYGSGVTAPVWALAIDRGAPGWSVVRSAPPRLLGEPDEGGVPRLVALATELGADVVHVSIEDSVAAAVVEARAGGEWAISGYSFDGLSFSGIDIDEARARPRIDLVDVPPPARAAFDGSFEDALATLVESLGGGHDDDASASSLVAGIPRDGVRHVELARAHPPPSPRPPLMVELQLEHAELGTRWRLRSGDGEMWIDGVAIDAPDAQRGARFAKAIAEWLDVSIDPRAASIPCRSWGTLREMAAPRTPGSRMLSVGDRDPIRLRLHANDARTAALIEEDDPALRGLVAATLTRVLAGVTTADDPLVPVLESIGDELTTHALATFAGETPVVASWRLGRTVFVADGRELLEEEGIVTALAGAGPERVLAALVTPRMHGRSQGYAQDDPARIVEIDLSRGAVRTLLQSGDGITFGFTRIVPSPDRSEVAIAIERGRDRRTRIVEVDRLGAREIAGRVVAWDRAGLIVGHAARSGETELARVDPDGARAGPPALVSPDGAFEVVPEPGALLVRDGGRVRRVDPSIHAGHTHASAWIGPHALLVGHEPPDVLDLDTLERRPLFGAEGLRFESCSESFRRVLANVDQRRIWLGEVRSPHARSI